MAAFADRKLRVSNPPRANVSIILASRKEVLDYSSISQIVTIKSIDNYIDNMRVYPFPGKSIPNRTLCDFQKQKKQEEER